MSVVYSHALKYSEGEAMRNQEMDSSFGFPQQNCHQQNSGLLRLRSAPSSLLTNLVDNTNSIGCVNLEAFRNEDHQHYLSPTSEMETMLAKLISSNNGLTNSESLQEFGDKPVVKQEEMDLVSQEPQQNGYSYASPDQLIYQQPQQIQGLPNDSLGAAGNNFDSSFNSVSSLASENYTQTKMGSSNCSNLIRQKSSPAGFFSNYSVDNGLASMREVGSFRGSDVSNGQATTSSSGLHGTLNFSSRPSSCSSRMPQIVESEHESLQANCVESRNLGNSFTSDFWDGSAFNAPKTARNNGEIMFTTSNGLDTQDVDFGYQKLGLSHHLSLPSSSRMQKLYQIQGSVPCKIRAKRGFATHPRSIAERERRTRISARIKKLQDLFPKSDKQTSTADLLDFAVDYIKDLQKQVKTLTETRAKCTCTSK
ncbi:Myc-type, basic helix-loop-helix [Sesbania bispinosa]|nr:Myc-type, basic helix-loop-helix [Sesbania bispinosa]